jgi:hypothetical protein
VLILWSTIVFQQVFLFTHPGAFSPGKYQAFYHFKKGSYLAHMSSKKMELGDEFTSFF